MNIEEIVPTIQLDVSGEPCPYPAIATLEVLPQLNKGEVLEVICDCPQSINSIPVDAKNHGYELLAIEQHGPTIRYLIRNNK